MTSRTVLIPEWVLTGDGVVRTGCAVVVEDEKITAIVSADETVADAIRIELPGHLLMPGLANLHTHVGAGPIARAISEDYSIPAGMPFYVPLSQLWKHAYSDELRDQYRSVVQWDLLAMMRTGTTTVVNHASTDAEGYFDIALESGVRTFAGPTVPLNVTHRLGRLQDGHAHRRDLAALDSQIDELADMRKLFAQWNGRDGRISVLLGPAAVHAVEPTVLESVAKLADEFDCLVTTHLCQAPSELSETNRRYGLTPLRVLERMGLTNHRLLAAHGTYLPDADLELAADSGMTLVHCASRKAKEAMISPSVRFRDAGITVGLGTDGFSCDMVEELKFAAILGKIGTAATDRPTAFETVRVATSGAAKSLGRSDLGSIQVGATADLIAIDLSGPVTGPVFDPLQTLVYYGNGRDVAFSMIGGRIIMQHGRFAGADLDSVRRAAQDALAGIWEHAVREGLIAEALPSAVGRPVRGVPTCLTC